ncbi:AfsR/SARP family transcriptional regulator [Couchioplanes caeruleus]|uniref:AfsR/SARP family transcriptional regulator n=1 Tax=Couchioplanes caeruleus TaxID=56438 RepID=UPI0031F75AD5
MQFGVLGPLMIDGVEVSQIMTAPKPRSVLAMLMLEPNRAVSTTALIQELWQENPPRSALTTLQTYVLQLRKMFRGMYLHDAGQAGRNILVTRLPGYMLRVDESVHDLSIYENLVTQGQAYMSEQRYEQASDAFTRALRLWRGEPLTDVRPGPLLELHVRRLEESRLIITELRIEAELRLGHFHEVLSELTQLVGRHPMHEGFRAQYMVALFRAGRLRAALDSFQGFRTLLVDDLGLEPSARLQELHHAILTGSTELASTGR